MALPSGTHLGPYEIVSLLGAGGMGEVYRARDTGLKLGFALKPGHALGIAGKELVIARNQRRRPIAPNTFSYSLARG